MNECYNLSFSLNRFGHGYGGGSGLVRAAGPEAQQGGEAAL